MKSIKRNFCALALACISASLVARTVETNTIQVLIDPNASWSVYAANIGGSITDNPATDVPAGSSVLANGLIFPKGTVNLNQQDYRVDRNGNPLTTLNSIGTLYMDSNALVNSDPEPALGTTLTQFNDVFQFNTANGSTPNQIFTIGTEQLINNYAPGVTSTSSSMAVLGGTGRNQNAAGIASAQLHVAPDGQSAILEVRFNKKISVTLP